MSYASGQLRVVPHSIEHRALRTAFDEALEKAAQALLRLEGSGATKVSSELPEDGSTR